MFYISAAKQLIMLYLLLLYALLKFFGPNSDTLKTVSEKMKCDGEIFNDEYYDKEILFTDLETPRNLVLDKLREDLFFRQTDTEGYVEHHKITVCNINRKLCTDIKNIREGYTVAYHSENEETFIGSNNGIYVYNGYSQTPEYFAEEGKSIRDMSINGKYFYYVQNPNGKLHVYNATKFTTVKLAENMNIEHFFISKDTDIYYSNATGLFTVKNGRKESETLSKNISVAQITENASGDIYFVTGKAIYVDNKFTTLKLVADIHGIYGLTFDWLDRPIMANNSTIFRLSPNNNATDCIKVKMFQNLNGE